LAVSVVFDGKNLRIGVVFRQGFEVEKLAIKAERGAFSHA
jgi:hypothetical protein